LAAGGAVGLGIKEGLAFETAGGDAGKGVEHAQEVVQVRVILGGAGRDRVP
jgi:hypothetical protein